MPKYFLYFLSSHTGDIINEGSSSISNCGTSSIEDLFFVHLSENIGDDTSASKSIQFECLDATTEALRSIFLRADLIDGCLGYC